MGYLMAVVIGVFLLLLSLLSPVPPHARVVERQPMLVCVLPAAAQPAEMPTQAQLAALVPAHTTGSRLPGNDEPPTIRSATPLELERVDQAGGLPDISGDMAWQLLNSPFVLGAIGSGIGWLWHKATKRSKRLAELSQEAFHVAEATGVTDKLSGNQKYGVFVRTITDALQAENGKALTDTEKAMLAAKADRLSSLAKLVTPAAQALLAGGGKAPLLAAEK